MIRALGFNESITRANLSQNLLGAGGAPAVDEFGEVLAGNIKLKYLNLAFNLITTKSAELISYYLRGNTTLKELNLDGNPISERGLRALY